MKLSIIIKCSFFILFVGLTLLGCRKQDHFYKDFIKGGEIVYVGKADSILFQPGRNRVKLSWAISDPNINKMKVYWDSHQDSVVLNINKTEGVDSVHVIIDNLDERFYSFEVYSYDALGNTSIKTLAEGQVYGAEYNASLLNRSIDKVTYQDNQANISWFGASKTVIGTEVLYTDRDGEDRNIFVSDTVNSILLENVEVGLAFKYRTWFRPSPLSIDTFYTEFETRKISLVEIELDYSKFKEHRLLNDPLPAWTNKVEFLWNNNLSDKESGSGGWYRTDTDSGIPNQITIDMGVKAKLSRFKFWQRGTVKELNLLYANSSPRKFELWGWNDDTEPAEDGIYAGSHWVKLMDCETIRPSGLNPGDALTQEDLAAASAGHEFSFPLDAPAVRYIRYRVTETFEPSQQFFLSEIGVFGQPDIQL